MDRVLERSNLQRALKQVRSNRGAPGIDGMSVDALPSYLKEHWLKIRAQLVAGRYRPRPVRRVEIPKPDGRKRPLGIPTVLDRFIQQAIAQVVSAQWEAHFHPRSYGFRPQRSAHQAVRQLQADIRACKRWVVDLDLEAFFDRVNHDRLMVRLKQHVPDVALLRLIKPLPSDGRFFAEAGALVTYSVDWPDLFRRSASYVDRILRGAKPGDLPIEQPTKFELVVNLQTGEALRIRIPESILVRADRVIR
jgi:hypothetical protein